MDRDINSKKGCILSKGEVLELLNLSATTVSKNILKKYNIVKLDNNSYYVLNKSSLEEDNELISLIQNIYRINRDSLSDYLEEENLDNNRFEKIFTDIEDNWNEEIEDMEDECLIVYVNSPGRYATGWSKSKAKKINIDWRQRQEKKNYSFEKGEIIRYKSKFENDKVYAKDWSNSNIDSPKKQLQIFFEEDSPAEFELKQETLDEQEIIFIETGSRLINKIDEYEEGLKFKKYELKEFLNQADLFYNQENDSTHKFLRKNLNLRRPKILSRIEPSKLTREQRIQSEIALTEISRKGILHDLKKKGRRRWLVFADEHRDNNTFQYMYTLISPKVDLDSLISTSPFFHSSNEKDFADEILEISELIAKEKNIFNYSFEYSTVSNNIHKNTRNALFTTLPLVLEIIRAKAGPSYRVQVLAERSSTHILDENAQPFDEIIKNAEDINRKKTFKAELPWTMVAKNPVEHPYQAYADIIGRWSDDNKNASILYPGYSVTKYSENYELFVCMKELIRNTLNPELFFKGLIISKEENIVNYFGKNEILGGSINTAFRTLLSNNKQQKLFDIIKNNSENNISQKIIEALNRRIVEILIEESALMNLEGATLQFEFFMNLFSHAIKTDNLQIMKSTGELLNNIKKNPEIKKERVQKLQNLSTIAKQNMFSFDIDISIPISVKERYSIEEFNLLGTFATSLLLSGVEENITKGKEIEDLLFDRTKRYDEGYKRRLTNKIEIENMEDPQNALRLIKQYDLLNCEKTSEISGFLLAVCLKCISIVDYESLDGTERNLKEYAQDFISNKQFNLLPSIPDNRVAYWFLKACFKLFKGVEIPEHIQNNVENCSEFLLELKENEWWRHNCKGIMVSCQLLDLTYHHGEHLENYRNKVNDFVLHLESVINSEKTADTTRKWINENYPNEQDWLRPLNYNYR